MRKLEFFRDGRVGHACRDHASTGTALGCAPESSFVDIQQSPEFECATISAQAFKALWLAYVQSGDWRRHAASMQGAS